MSRWNPAPQVAAAPEPVRTADPHAPIIFPAYHGPALPPPGVPRPAFAALAYTEATAPIAADETGEHGEIVTQPGTPVGTQIAWDGPRRLTFRIAPQPWDTGLLVEPTPTPAGRLARR